MAAFAPHALGLNCRLSSLDAFLWEEAFRSPHHSCIYDGTRRMGTALNYRFLHGLSSSYLVFLAQSHTQAGNSLGHNISRIHSPILYLGILVLLGSSDLVSAREGNHHMVCPSHFSG